MKLERVIIKNFRSIKEIEIDFDPTCRVLVGINESGKSNILSALSFLTEKNPNKREDLREALPDEEEVKEAYVKFVFRLEKDESVRLIEFVSSNILTSAKNPDIVSTNGKNEKIREFCNARNKGNYYVDILAENKRAQYYKLKKNCKLLEGWKKPTANFVFELNGQEYELTNYKLIRAADFPDIPDEYLGEAKTEDLAKLCGRGIGEIIRENLPKTLFWEYNEANFLPESVEIEVFSQNPDSCAPLKNMFTLANVDNIKETLEHAQAGSPNQFGNFLNRIAKKTTNHFRNVWKEYRNIEFSLERKANTITPGIKEKNTYDFARRSDGFKRFVTFLLMVSANVKTDKIRNALLLIDEPETSLHPSGAKYLRDELINISKKNYVVYSTHSIFMIDQSDLKRHYIVKKKKEITSVEIAEQSNIREEEVLYNALGYSVFSILEESNLIFEGWRDKHLFKTALENASHNLREKYKDVGICYAQGVRTIGKISPMIELAKRNCLIISDGDKAAKDQKRAYENNKGFGRWKTYQDIDPSIKAVTAEDFIKNDFITEQVKTALQNNETPDFDETVLPLKRNKLSEIRKWLRNQCGMSNQEIKEKITEVKELIYENLSPSDIKYEEYEKLLTGISFD